LVQTVLNSIQDSIRFWMQPQFNLFISSIYLAFTSLHFRACVYVPPFQFRF